MFGNFEYTEDKSAATRSVQLISIFFKIKYYENNNC